MFTLLGFCCSVRAILSGSHDFLAIRIWYLFKSLNALHELSQLKYPRRIPLRKLGADYTDPRERPELCNTEKREKQMRGLGKAKKNSCLYKCLSCSAKCTVSPTVYVFLMAWHSEWGSFSHVSLSSLNYKIKVQLRKSVLTYERSKVTLTIHTGSAHYVFLVNVRIFMIQRFNRDTRQQ